MRLGSTTVTEGSGTMRVTTTFRRRMRMERGELQSTQSG
jgi:hypothetical protein